MAFLKFNLALLEFNSTLLEFNSTLLKFNSTFTEFDLTFITQYFDNLSVSSGISVVAFGRMPAVV